MSIVKWDKIADHFKFAAMDENSRISVFTHMPTAMGNSWFILARTMDSKAISSQKTHKEPTGQINHNWKHTLEQRPTQ